MADYPSWQPGWYPPPPHGYSPRPPLHGGLGPPPPPRDYCHPMYLTYRPFPYWTQRAYHGQPVPPQAPRHQAPFKANKSAYPEISPILACDMTFIKYDVRKAPEHGMDMGCYYGFSGRSAGAKKELTTLHLISKDFPWSFTVEGDEAKPITCNDVWQKLHEELELALENCLWGALDDKRRRKIVANFEHRKREDKEGDTQLMRMDWLGRRTVFVGVEKDDAFAKSRALPGSDDGEETWVVKMEKW